MMPRPIGQLRTWVRFGWGSTAGGRVLRGDVAGDGFGAGAGVALQTAHRGVAGAGQQQRGVDAVARHVAATDPAARRKSPTAPSTGPDA